MLGLRQNSGYNVRKKSRFQNPFSDAITWAKTIVGWLCVGSKELRDILISRGGTWQARTNAFIEGEVTLMRRVTSMIKKIVSGRTAMMQYLTIDFITECLLCEHLMQRQS